MEYLNLITNWVKARWSERSTWDGTALIGMGVLAMIASPLIKYASWAAIAYGAYRIWQKESINVDGE